MRKPESRKTAFESPDGFKDHNGFHSLHVWIRNEKGWFLVTCQAGTDSDSPSWGPLRSSCDGDLPLNAAVHLAVGALGIILTPSMGTPVKMSPFVSEAACLFDCQNSDIDHLFPLSDAVKSFLWVSPAMIGVMMRCGLWDREDHYDYFSHFPHETFSFRYLFPDHILDVLDTMLALSVHMIRANRTGEADLLIRQALNQMENPETPWNSEETDRITDLLHSAYFCKAYLSYLSKDMEKSVEEHLISLRLMEEVCRKKPTSDNVSMLYHIHGKLELLYQALNQTQKARQEQQIRQDLTALRDSIWDTEIKNWDLPVSKKRGYVPDYFLEKRDDAFFILQSYKNRDRNIIALSIPSLIDNAPVAALQGPVFNSLDKLKSVFIPDTINYIDRNPFVECIHLEKITIDPGNRSFRMVNHCLMTADGRKLVFCLPGPPDTVCTIPEGTVVIGTDAFWGCNNLKKIIIPESVTRIENGAFFHCDGLEEIKWPHSVPVISNHTFAGCSSLKSFIIPSTVNRIGDFAFTECEKLETIVIPHSVQSVGDYAFSFCPALRHVTYPLSVAEEGECIFEESPVN